MDACECDRLVSALYDVRVKFLDWEIQRLAGETVPAATPAEVNALRLVALADEEYPGWFEREKARREAANGGQS